MELLDLHIWLQFVRPDDVFTLIPIVLLGHPFKREKKLLWVCFVWAFLWNIWLERNARIFTDKHRDFDLFVDSTTLLAINWSKLSLSFLQLHFIYSY